MLLLMITCVLYCAVVHYSLYLYIVELFFLVCVKTMRRGALLSFSCYCLYPGTRGAALFLGDGFGLF